MSKKTILRLLGVFVFVQLMSLYGSIEMKTYLTNNLGLKVHQSTNVQEAGFWSWLVGSKVEGACNEALHYKWVYTHHWLFGDFGGHAVGC